MLSRDKLWDNNNNGFYLRNIGNTTVAFAVSFFPARPGTAMPGASSTDPEMPNSPVLLSSPRWEGGKGGLADVSKWPTIGSARALVYLPSPGPLFPNYQPSPAMPTVIGAPQGRPCTTPTKPFRAQWMPKTIPCLCWPLPLPPLISHRNGYRRCRWVYGNTLYM